MAVVFGAVVIVGGLAVAHGDYSDYENYGDYSDYDDEDEEIERLRRIESLREETEKAANTLSEYKSGTVNPKLSSQALKETSAMEVSEDAMDKDVRSSLEKEKDHELLRDTEELQKEMQQIDNLLEKIEKIERGQ